MADAGWNVDTGDDMPIEVYPVGDLREHVLAASGKPCWCGAVDEDGVIIHTSADGREAFETGERKSS
jgi:hypothetical protein